MGSYLSGVTFLLFGAVLVPLALAELDVATAVYAVLSLTVVRMLPVALALTGTGARWPTRAFVGWFGPRGLATVVFALTVVEEFDVPGAPRIVAVATVTVLLSILAHGLTASALAWAGPGDLARGHDGIERWNITGSMVTHAALCTVYLVLAATTALGRPRPAEAFSAALAGPAALAAPWASCSRRCPC